MNRASSDTGAGGWSCFRVAPRSVSGRREAGQTFEAPAGGFPVAPHRAAGGGAGVGGGLAGCRWREGLARQFSVFHPGRSLGQLGGVLDVALMCGVRIEGARSWMEAICVRQWHAPLASSKSPDCKENVMLLPCLFWRNRSKRAS